MWKENVGCGVGRGAWECRWFTGMPQCLWYWNINSTHCYCKSSQNKTLLSLSSLLRVAVVVGVTVEAVGGAVMVVMLVVGGNSILMV